MDIKKFGFYFLLGIILVIAFKFMSIIYFFFPAIAFAFVLAYLFNPIYTFFLKITKKRSISAIIIICIISILILIPVAIAVLAVQNQIQIFFTESSVDSILEVLNKFEDFTYDKFNIQLSDYYINDLPSKVITTLQQAITNFGPRMIYGISGVLLSIFVIFFLLFYLLKNSKRVIKTFVNYFPLSYENCYILLNEMGKDTKTLILGHLLIAIIQGLFGALGFLIFSINGAILWGFVMMLVSFIPFLGPFIVWFPACLYLVFRGDYIASIGLFLWGSLVVGTSDNIIRPKLTSSLGTLHPVTVLLGVFIGLKEWGVIGIVIGPLTISVLIILIKMFREEYLVEDDSKKSTGKPSFPRLPL